MPLVLLRLAVVVFSLVCVWRMATSVQQSMARAAEVAQASSLPFTLLAAGILVAALAYALGKLRRP